MVQRVYVLVGDEEGCYVRRKFVRRSHDHNMLVSTMVLKALTRTRMEAIYRVQLSAMKCYLSEHRKDSDYSQDFGC